MLLSRRLTVCICYAAMMLGCSRLVPPPNHVPLKVELDKVDQVVFSGFISNARTISVYRRDQYAVYGVQVRALDISDASVGLMWQALDQSVFAPSGFRAWDEGEDRIVYGELLPGFIIKQPPKPLKESVRYSAGIGLLGKQGDGTKEQNVSSQVVFSLGRDEKGNLRIIVE